MKVVILAGGFGTRISEESQFKPKPMIEIGGKPILWHIMKWYSKFGHNEFIICCGYKQQVIKNYFANYYMYNSDMTFDFSANGKVTVHSDHTEDWRVTVVDTGLNTMTGGRLKRVKDYISGEPFLMTYGDGVSDVDINECIRFHEETGTMVTLTGVLPEGRFGVMDIDGSMIRSFREKSRDDMAWLLMLGAEVYGYSNSIPTQPSMFEVVGLPDRIHHHYGDIRNKEEMSDYVQAVKPDFIFHLAAQAIVSTSYKEPFDTITTNVVGTASVLEAIRNITWNCTCVLITSDKAYDNVEWIWGYRETDAVGGKDVYSGSKGAAELTIKCYWKSFIQAMPNIKLGVARAGNVIGGGDWAKDRIIVDCVKAFSRNEVVEIRSPKATRPWQHVLEPLSGYLNLGQYLYEGKVENGEPFNFGPRAEQTKTVFQLVQDLAELWGLDRNTAARLTGNVPFEEATLLKLNCDKALVYLDWHSTLHYEECVHFIADWYKAFYTDANVDMYSLTTAQIDSYVRAAGAQHLKWAE